VSITDLIPALKGTGRRRAADKVEELREENVRLWDRQAAADDFFALLMQDVTETNTALKAEKERRENAERALAQAEDAIRLRDRRIADLERRVDVGVKAEHVIAKTQELPVEEIRRHCVMPLHQSPLANPAHVPAWASKGDDTQPIPAP